MSHTDRQTNRLTGDYRQSFCKKTCFWNLRPLKRVVPSKIGIRKFSRILYFPFVKIDKSKKEV